MIVLNLICTNQHRFEFWFDSNDAFESQHSSNGVLCPYCGIAEVARLPAAPRIKRQAGAQALAKDSAAPKAPDASREAALFAVFQRLIAESEDVGDRFPEEARKIHYEEVSPRKIRGRSTAAEALELLEEGIPVLPLPVPSTGDMH